MTCFRLYWNILSLRGAKSVARVIWVMLNNTYCIPAYFAYMLLLSPLLLVSKDLYWWLESRQVRIIRTLANQVLHAL